GSARRRTSRRCGWGSACTTARPCSATSAARASWRSPRWATPSTWPAGCRASRATWGRPSWPALISSPLSTRKAPTPRWPPAWPPRALESCGGAITPSRCGPAPEQNFTFATHALHTRVRSSFVRAGHEPAAKEENDMLSRRAILGSVAVLAAGLITGVAAFAQGGGPGFRHGMMKRMATAMIDEALEPAQVTPEQRAKIYAARDRAFAGPPSKMSGPPSKISALLVEDDARLGSMVAEYLGRHEIDVTVVGDGERGLAALRRGRFDVVLLDVMLPGIDGLEVCRRLRAAPEWAALPILMLTARGEDVDKIVGLELGADDYLAKPFNPRELLARVRAILRRGAAEASRARLVAGALV